MMMVLHWNHLCGKSFTVKAQKTTLREIFVQVRWLKVRLKLLSFGPNRSRYSQPLSSRHSQVGSDLPFSLSTSPILLPKRRTFIPLTRDNFQIP